MSESMRPEDIESTSFAVAFRGFDRDEVQAFLSEVAESIRVYQRIADEAYRVVGEEMGDLLQGAKEQADRVVSDATARAEQIMEEGRAELDRMRREAESEATETRAAAEADARARIEAAEENVDRLRRAELEAREELARLGHELEALTKRVRDLDHTSATEEIVYPQAGGEARIEETVR
jgi:DivIVA domain-containing protein